MTFLDALANHAFLQRALFAGLLASVGCGMIGTFVVVKRISFLAGGIAHAVLGGMGMAHFLGQDPLLGALAASIVAALLIGWVNLKWREREDTLIGALWAVGMAVGIVFMAQTPGYNVDLMSYLFGNILMVAPEHLRLMVGLDVGIAMLMFLFFKQFVAVSFDEEFARIRGVRVTLFYLLLLCLVALTVVLLIQVVGIILVIALLTLPAAIAGHYVKTLRVMMVLAVLVGGACTTAGMVLSYRMDLPTGAVIILTAAAAYFLSGVGKALRTR